MPSTDHEHRNPDNPKETWTGRGIEPLWFLKASEEGKIIVKEEQVLYRNPDKPEETWTGRGAELLWYLKAREAGKCLDPEILEE